MVQIRVFCQDIRHGEVTKASDDAGNEEEQRPEQGEEPFEQARQEHVAIVLHKTMADALEGGLISWSALQKETANIAGIFYVNPYYQATLAEAYRFLRENAICLHWQSCRPALFLNSTDQDRDALLIRQIEAKAIRKLHSRKCLTLLNGLIE